MQVRSQLTQAKIIQAAYDLFSEKGFDKTSTREIAERAGVAELTLFRHFQNKHNIFYQVCLKYSPVLKMDAILAEIEALPFKEGLNQLTLMLMNHLKANRDMVRSTLISSALDDEMKALLNPLRQKMLGKIVTFFSRHLAGKLPEGIQIEELVHTYLWSIMSAVTLFEPDNMEVLHTSSDRMCEVLEALVVGYASDSSKYD